MERKTLSALIGIVLVVLIGAAACICIEYESDLGSEQYGANNKFSTIDTTNQNDLNNKAAASGIDTADWKTYTNTKYGYAVKYPADGSFVEVPSGIENADDKGYDIDFSFGKSLTIDGIEIMASKNARNDKTIGELVETRNNVAMANTNVPGYAEKIQIDGKPAFEWITYLGGPGSQRIGAIALLFDGSDYYYVVRTGDQFSPEFTAEKEKIFNTFLSTFKFTTSGDISNWKTYNNSKFGFSIDYPNNWNVGVNSLRQEPSLVFCPPENIDLSDPSGCKSKQNGSHMPDMQTPIIYLSHYTKDEYVWDLNKEGVWLSPDKNSVYELELAGGTYDDVYKKMLSTFKFAK